MDPPSSDQPNLHKAKHLLYRRLKVVTKDGRTLAGDLVCMDKEQNLILSGAVQRTVNAHTGEPEERVLGQVMVPLDHRQECSVEVFPHELERFQRLVEPTDYA
eukprot:scaffold220021_cov45-Prasinocladus_malaysianus.AAC.1